MAKLADAADLKSAESERVVGVQVPLPAPTNLLLCSALLTDQLCAFKRDTALVSGSVPNSVPTLLFPSLNAGPTALP